MSLTTRYPKFATPYICVVGLLICFAHTTWADPCATPTPPAPVATGTPTGVHLNIVAHQDDDVLFMNPDILNNVKEGRRQVTVYITAGNVFPGEQAYATEREEAAIAGYSKLLQLADAKIIDSQHFQDLSGTFQGDSRFPAGCNSAPAHCFPCTEHADELSGPGDARGEKTLLHIPNSRVLNGATIGDGPGGPRVTLIFLRVNSPAPDNLGQLFTSSNHNLQIGSPFSQQGYTKQSLINQLVQIINFYQPDTVRTQDPADGHIVDPAFQTTIGSASNGQTLPKSTINVASTTGFPPSAIIYINVGGVHNYVLYTGLTSSTLTGCILDPPNPDDPHPPSTLATGSVVTAISGEEVRDQGCAPPFPGTNSYDHSDHVWGARFAREALKKYNHNFPLGKKPDYFIYNGYNLEWNELLGNRVSTEDFCLKKSILYRNALHDYYIIGDHGFCTDPNFPPLGVAALFCRTQYAVPFNRFYYWYMGYQRREQRSLP